MTQAAVAKATREDVDRLMQSEAGALEGCVEVPRL